ncbi:MAG: DUF4184 family protein [Ferruginibacter sp.]
MPFTFSHPAIVLPMQYLPRRWYSLTGLITGSLVPDFEYFLRMKIQSNYSHTVIGLFWFDIPLGLLLTFIFHNLVRDSLFDNLPASLKSRLLGFKQFNWNSYFKASWPVVTISILIGAASHILWDGFTHWDDYFVMTIPALTNWVHIFGKPFPVFKVLLFFSNLIGGLVVVFALFKLPADKNITSQFNLKYWSILTSLTITIFTIRFLNGLNFKLYGHLAVAAISATLISLILTSLLTRQKKPIGA